MVIRDNKNVGKSPKAVPVMISNIALINSVKTSDTATIDAVSETKNIAQPLMKAMYGP